MCHFISSIPQRLFFLYFVVVVVKWEEPVMSFQADIFTGYVEQLVALGYVE
jgi:hypothetical protein